MLERGRATARICFCPVSHQSWCRSARTSSTGWFRGRREVDPDLVEWDYGQFEGIPTERRPRRAARLHDCSATGAPAANARRRCAAGRPLHYPARGIAGDVLAFSSGHIIQHDRRAAARPAARAGRCLDYPSASLGVLGFEHNSPRQPTSACGTTPSRRQPGATSAVSVAASPMSSARISAFVAGMAVGATLRA